MMADTITPEALVAEIDHALPLRTVHFMLADGRLPGEQHGRRWHLPRDAAVEAAREIVRARQILKGSKTA